MGGGVPSKTRRRPHEPGVRLPEGSPLLGDLEAHARTVQGPCCPRLDGLPLPRSARRWTKGEAQRNVQARALHEKGRGGAPCPMGASSAIAWDAAGSLAGHQRRERGAVGCTAAQAVAGAPWQAERAISLG